MKRRDFFIKKTGVVIATSLTLVIEKRNASSDMRLTEKGVYAFTYY